MIITRYGKFIVQDDGIYGHKYGVYFEKIYSNVLIGSGMVAEALYRTNAGVYGSVLSENVIL